MAKTIITQDGDIVNYRNIIAVFVSEDLDDNENLLGYYLIGTDVTNENILLGEYATLDEVMQAKNEIIKWLDSEMLGMIRLSEKDGDDV